MTHGEHEVRDALMLALIKELKELNKNLRSLSEDGLTEIRQIHPPPRILSPGPSYTIT